MAQSIEAETTTESPVERLELGKVEQREYVSHCTARPHRPPVPRQRLVSLLHYHKQPYSLVRYAALLTAELGRTVLVVCFAQALRLTRVY